MKGYTLKIVPHEEHLDCCFANDNGYCTAPAHWVAACTESTGIKGTTYIFKEVEVACNPGLLLNEFEALKEAAHKHYKTHEPIVQQKYDGGNMLKDLMGALRTKESKPVAPETFVSRDNGKTYDVLNAIDIMDTCTGCDFDESNGCKAPDDLMYFCVDYDLNHEEPKIFTEKDMSIKGLMASFAGQ